MCIQDTCQPSLGAWIINVFEDWLLYCLESNEIRMQLRCRFVTLC